MELRCYESVVVFVPELEDPQLEEEVNWVKGLLEGGGAQLVTLESWGKRRLAYEIEERREGHYFLFRFRASGAMVDELERNYRLRGSIIRYLTVRLKERECKRPQETPRPGSEVEEESVGHQY